MSAAARVGLAAAGAVVVWLVIVAVLAMFTRPRRPAAGPAVMDVGDEPPAVANLLANGWQVGREAVPATLLDLAARKLVSIEQVSPERFVCRVRTGGHAELSRYERQVLEHVRSLAVDGVVPCEALTTGPAEQSGRWWKEFRRAVVTDARDRGLSRDRWSRTVKITLAVTALAPAVLATVAIGLAPSSETTSSSDDPGLLGYAGIALIVWLLLLAIPAALRTERETPAGLRAAARWLGLREFLHEDQAFADQPPAAVAIWDRYLAYGAALGVAVGAVRALPLGSESDRDAWSSFGGRWHLVRVRYPRRVPPGWGKHPAAAAAIGLFWLVVAGAAAVAAGPALGDGLRNLTDHVREHGWEPIVGLGVGVFGVMAVALAVGLLRALAMFLVAVTDVAARRDVEGLVVRVRTGSGKYIAVDDATRARVRAWLVQPAVASGIAQGLVVRATVSPRLGHVFRLEPVIHTPASARSGSGADPKGCTPEAPAPGPRG